MNTKQLYWVADGGHEWLAVPASLADNVRGISPYSYISPNGRTAYLEGDLDAALFLEHYQLAGLPETAFSATQIWEDDCPVRKYPHYYKH